MMPASEPRSATPAIELVDVEKRFGDFVAVAGVSLTVPAGSVYGLLGPNGAGKTTSIRMLMDIIAPDSGAVRILGRPRTADDRQRIGYLPEERGLYKKMKVAEHLAFLGEVHGLPRSDAKRLAAEWLERLGLDDRAERKVEELSKGMQQKIQLAGTLLHDPEIVILDEPFSGLDPINQGVFKEVLAGYKEQGKTILFSTHVMEQAEKLCDHIGLISGGEVVLTGELGELKRRFGGNSYRLEATGPLERLESVAGVDKVAVNEGGARLFLAPEASGAEVLRELVGFLEVTEFRSGEPDLEEIFITAVNDAAA